MNKRIKKKRELENSLRIAGSAIEFLFDQNNQLWKIVENMENINSHNTQATNERFDKLEAANEEMKLDLDNAVISFTKPKKSNWFGRKQGRSQKMKYRKKPVVVEAEQWTGENVKEIAIFMGIESIPYD